MDVGERGIGRRDTRRGRRVKKTETEWKAGQKGDGNKGEEDSNASPRI